MGGDRGGPGAAGGTMLGSWRRRRPGYGAGHGESGDGWWRAAAGGGRKVDPLRVCLRGSGGVAAPEGGHAPARGAAGLGGAPLAWEPSGCVCVRERVAGRRSR